MTAWDACNHPRPPMSHFIGKPCYIGLDLASVSDFACIAYLFEEDGYLFPYIKNYLPMDTITDKSGVMGSSYREWLDLGHITATDGSVTDLQKFLLKEKLSFKNLLKVKMLIRIVQAYLKENGMN